MMARNDLPDCRECDMCGGCEACDGCLHDFDHIAWFTRFASPGEPACNQMGTPQACYPDRPCALPVNHDGTWHQDRRGNGWRTPTTSQPAP